MHHGGSGGFSRSDDFQSSSDSTGFEPVVVSRWVKAISAAFTRTGKMERPRPARLGRKSKMTPELDAWIRTAVAGQPDLTLAELQFRLDQDWQFTISIGSLWNTLRRLNLRLKKNHARRRTG